MRSIGFALSIFLAAALLSGCKVKKHLQVAEANEADATLVLQYEHGFEHYVVDALIGQTPAHGQACLPASNDDGVCPLHDYVPSAGGVLPTGPISEGPAGVRRRLH